MSSIAHPYVMVVSILHLAFAVFYFVRSGKSLLLFSDSFVCASAVFIGVPGLITCLLWPTWVNEDYAVVSTLGFGFVLAVSFSSYLFRNILIQVKPSSKKRHFSPSSFRFYRTLTWLVIIVTILVTIASFRGGNLGPVPRNLAFLSVILSFMQLVFSGPFLKSFPNRWLIPLTTVLVVVGYFKYFFDGGGRLVVATLLYALAFVAGTWYPKLPIKKIILAGLMPAILFFAYIRGNTGEFEDVLVAADGLESVFGPYQICASVVNHINIGVMDFQYLEPIKSTLFFWVPRFLWAQKPFGFGFELTRHFHPELVFQDHSMAATYLGEIYASAGWLAVSFCFPLIVFGITWLDILMCRRMEQKVLDASFFLRTVVFAILTAGVFDYVWVGSFTFFSRNILRLVLLLGMTGIVWGMDFLVRSSWSENPKKWATDVKGDSR